MELAPECPRANATRVPSGGHAGSRASAALPGPRSRRAPPSAALVEMSLPNDNPILWNAMRPVHDHDGYAAKTSTASVIASGLPPSSGITRISPSYATASRVPSGDQVIRPERRGYTRGAPEPPAAPTSPHSGPL